MEPRQTTDLHRATPQTRQQMRSHPIETAPSDGSADGATTSDGSAVGIAASDGSAPRVARRPAVLQPGRRTGPTARYPGPATAQPRDMQVARRTRNTTARNTRQQVCSTPRPVDYPVAGKPGPHNTVARKPGPEGTSPGRRPSRGPVPGPVPHQPLSEAARQRDNEAAPPLSEAAEGRGTSDRTCRDTSRTSSPSDRRSQSARTRRSATSRSRCSRRRLPPRQP